MIMGTTITRRDVVELRAEAATAGDLGMVEICNAALNSSREQFERGDSRFNDPSSHAWRKCLNAIEHARAQVMSTTRDTDDLERSNAENPADDPNFVQKSDNAKTRARKRPALVTAATLEVQCPHCGDPQPSPGNGSHLWTPAEVSTSQGPRECDACDEPFTLHAQSRVDCVR
jgi:hypothetical protein